jgi:hypothetical protein
MVPTRSLITRGVMKGFVFDSGRHHEATEGKVEDSSHIRSVLSTVNRLYLPTYDVHRSLKKTTN